MKALALFILFLGGLFSLFECSETDFMAPGEPECVAIKDKIYKVDEKVKFVEYLTHFNQSSLLTIVIQFKDLDVLTFYSSIIVTDKFIERKLYEENKEPIDSLVLNLATVLEGWMMMKIDVVNDDQHISISYAKHRDTFTQLAQIPFGKQIETMKISASFLFNCKQLTPQWEVSSGKTVVVPLDSSYLLPTLSDQVLTLSAPAHFNVRCDSLLCATGGSLVESDSTRMYVTALKLVTSENQAVIHKSFFIIPLGNKAVLIEEPKGKPLLRGTSLFVINNTANFTVNVTLNIQSSTTRTSHSPLESVIENTEANLLGIYGYFLPSIIPYINIGRIFLGCLLLAIFMIQAHLIDVESNKDNIAKGIYKGVILVVPSILIIFATITLVFCLIDVISYGYDIYVNISLYILTTLAGCLYVAWKIKEICEENATFPGMITGAFFSVLLVGGILVLYSGIIDLLIYFLESKESFVLNNDNCSPAVHITNKFHVVMNIKFARIFSLTIILILIKIIINPDVKKSVVTFISNIILQITLLSQDESGTTSTACGKVNSDEYIQLTQIEDFSENDIYK